MTEIRDFRTRLRAALDAFTNPPRKTHAIYCEVCGKEMEMRVNATYAIGRCTEHSERPGIDTYRWGEDQDNLRQWDFEKMNPGNVDV